MMKIVDEIVLAVGDGRQWHTGTVGAGDLESIITAKLEPVKKALERAAHRFEYLHFGGVKECNGVDTVVASQDIRAALALFEDE